MEIIIPMAGLGTRMRPHTFSKPKPLMHVAGKPMLGHILDRLKSLNADKYHFIIGGFEPMIKDYISSYHLNANIIMQETPAGDGGAIMLAKSHINPESDVLIVFSDTVFESDLATIQHAKKDKHNIVWLKEVDDPRRFGVAFIEHGFITKFIEKPTEPISKLAVVGIYYLHSAKMMFDALEEVKSKNIQSKGEFRLIDALALLLTKGEKIAPATIDAWMDCGTPESLLDTNRKLLVKNHKLIKTVNSVIIDPVYIEDGAIIINSIIGPNVSIGAKTRIEDSIIQEAIIENGATIKFGQLRNSLIGQNTVVHGVFEQINIGDNSQLLTVTKDP